MYGGNPLLGSRANPAVVAGFSAGEYDGPESAAKSMAGESDFTALKVGLIVAGAALFVIALRRGGFRDMIVV